MITNHSFDYFVHSTVISKIIQLTQSKRWKIGFNSLKRFVNKLVLFICLESVLVVSIFFGTGYVVVLN